HAASLAKQEREGRVVLRRLNNREYGNTIDDLLGVRIFAGDTLPYDATAAGFAAVATAHDSSSGHLLLHYRLAGKALASAGDRSPREYMDYKEDGGAPFFVGDEEESRRKLGHAPGEGIYRVRFSAHALQTDKPVTLPLYKRPAGNATEAVII